MGSELIFIEKTHQYYLGGTELSSVTTILNQLNDFGRIPPDVLERKRQIGTAVHKAAELDDAGNLDPDSIDPAVAPYLEGWRKFRRESGFVPEYSEQRVYSTAYQYAGTLDRIGILNNELILLDIKARATDTPETALQTAAYAKAWEEMTGANLMHRRYSVRLTQDGNYRLVPHAGLTDFTVFLSCLTLYHWRISHGISND